MKKCQYRKICKEYNKKKNKCKKIEGFENCSLDVIK